jgi:hypothetical protein
LTEHATSFHCAGGSNSLHPQNNNKGDPWIIDYGATNHMTG